MIKFFEKSKRGGIESLIFVDTQTGELLEAVYFFTYSHGYHVAVYGYDEASFFGRYLLGSNDVDLSTVEVARYVTRVMAHYSTLYPISEFK